MLIEILVFISLGILAGIVTGLTPGIHINLVSLLIISSTPALMDYTTPLMLGIMIVSMAVTHTFLDAIPSIYLGAPDPDTILNILPGHKLLLEGKGFEAVKMTIIGSLLSLILAISIMPFLLIITNDFYLMIRDYIGYILIVVVGFMIIKDKNRHMNLILFLMAGCLGLAVLNIDSLKEPLFSMLSGLFGISTLAISLKDNVIIPEQSVAEETNVTKKEIIKSVVSSTAAGTLAAFFPGLGPSHGAVLASQFLRKISERGFLILVGGINTVNFTLSLVTLFVLSKARNGAVIAILKLLEGISMNDLIIFTGSALVAGGVATILALKISKIFSKAIAKINYKALVIGIISLITGMAIYFDAWQGLLVLLVSTMVGIIPAELGIARNHAMGCLLLPVILYFTV